MALRTATGTMLSADWEETTSRFEVDSALLNQEKSLARSRRTSERPESDVVELADSDLVFEEPAPISGSALIPGVSNLPGTGARAGAAASGTAVLTPESVIARRAQVVPDPVPPRRSDPPRPPAPAAPVSMIPVETLRALVAIYTEYLGPAAKPLLLAELTERGLAVDAVPRSAVGGIVSRLAARIDAAEPQSRFIVAVRRLFEE